MGNIFSNEFPVQGRTVAITGGSRGTGLAAARILAGKGANVVIIARGKDRLIEGVEHIRQGALNPETQRFHYISADLTSPSESTRIIDEIVEWNGGNPPDVVWCCAGSSHPTLFIDTPVSAFRAQMDSNYFSSMYIAHAAMTCWLKASQKGAAVAEAPKSAPPAPPARHLIFTASFCAFQSFAGYSPYSPSKAALRSLAETLSQEMNLYAAANPSEPRVRVHTVFPATILTEGYEEENRIKTDLTRLLEEADPGQTPEAIAAKSIKGLESGKEMITTDILTALVKRSMLGGSVRGGFLRAMGDWVVACLMGIIMVFVRDDMDRKVRTWGRKFGTSGMKGEDKRT
ncbi:hypothetical protein M426DRAFT_316285 [Hypoxylon sp. CI-4A]|nr:hypothetical protein M426DRAFT_316285 [Hypoxylon sp. CI-4A]